MTVVALKAREFFFDDLGIPESEEDLNLFKAGVVDIGSNSVRLVVFNNVDRFAIQVFNEKVLCGLARGLGDTGMLNPMGRELAKETVSRYITVLKGLGVEKIEVIATAAVRDAKDGADFVRELEQGGSDRLGFKKSLGIKVNTISGDEESRFAADGILYSIHNPTGVVGDLGGGSLELIELETSQIGARTSLPLGHFRLMDASDEKMDVAVKIAEKSLKNQDSLKWLKGRDFFAVGGGFRAIAKAHITGSSYPIKVVHNYRADPEDVLKLLNRLLDAKKIKAEDFPGLPQEREETIQYSAAVLREIIEIGKPRSIVFSASGVREGYLYSILTDKQRMIDPLIASSAYLATISGCNAEYSQELHKWLKNALPDVNGNLSRILHAIATLSEIAWAEHPEYRSEFCFDRAIEYPLIGFEHKERAFLALSLYHRHKTKLKKYFSDIAESVLSKDEIKVATTIGLCAAVAGKLSRGGVKPLSLVSLRIEKKRILVEEKESGGFTYLEGDAVKKLKKLSTHLDLPLESVERARLV